MFTLFALDIVNAKWDYTEYMQLVPSSLIFIEITKLIKIVQESFSVKDS